MKVSLSNFIVGGLLLQHAGGIALGLEERNGSALGTFQNPSARSRPRFRYWIPDASVNLNTVQEDIRDAGSVGAGGIELLGYYNYGDIEFDVGIIPTDWTEYGWGTPAWRAVQDTALQATKDNGLIIDLALGPNQGAGVPAPIDSDGLRWDLQPFNVSAPLGGSFDDILPGFGTGPLVAASTGLVVKVTNTSAMTNYTLAADSLQDVTDQVSIDGHLSINFTAPSSGQYHVVFAYYQIQTHYREQQTPELLISGEGVQQSPVTSYVQNGSFVVDHFSARGARQVASFWNQYLLNGSNTAELLQEVGNYLWEDSQEFDANILWTPSAPEVFQAQHGYSINKYLPILMHDNGGGVSITNVASSPAFVLDEGGMKYVSEFRQTMTSLNQQFLDGLTEFANSLGLQSSAQVAYNFPLDMLANIPHVNAPETETLGFSHNIDGYRQYSGPANLAGKRIISSEAGAVMGSVYQQTIPELLWDLKRSVVGGVNNFILHGMPYSGYYPNTTWPGYTTFFYLFSEMHNRHQPGWDYYRDFMDYTARTQHVMQSGVAKVDLAFWLKSTDYTSVTTQYWPMDLEQAGYTYEYLSPDNFELPAAYVEEGVLASEQQGFKAIVVRGNDTLTIGGVVKLYEWAQQGLTIVLSGGVPEKVSDTVSASEARTINATLARLVELPNVHQVPYADLANSLASLGVQPRTSLASSSEIWYTRWRQSDSESAIYLYYDALGLPADRTPLSNKTVTFEATGTPYIYHAWIGKQEPIHHYTQTNCSTTIPLSLAGNQTTIIAFRHGNNTPPSRRANIAPHQDLPPILLTNWTLTIESWTPPPDLFDIEGTIKTNTTFSIPSLLPWNKLTNYTNLNLTYTSGRGFYKTIFTRPVNATGAVITMSPIIHTAVLYVNGHKMPPLDVTAPRVDISEYLREGENEVEIVVSTPSGNVLLTVEGELLSMGAAPKGLPGVKEYGLVGEVVLRPYWQ